MGISWGYLLTSLELTITQSTWACHPKRKKLWVSIDYKKGMYELIISFMGNRSMLKPPQTCDLMALDDIIYTSF
jgi:hypothetical protein